MFAGINYGGLGFLVEEPPRRVALGSPGITGIQTIINDTFWLGSKPQTFNLEVEITSPNGKNIEPKWLTAHSGELAPNDYIAPIIKTVSKWFKKGRQPPTQIEQYPIPQKMACFVSVSFAELKAKGWGELDLIGIWNFKYTLTSPSFTEPKIRNSSIKVF